MKRWIAALCAMLCLLAVVPASGVSAAAVYVTDYAYVQMKAGGVDGTILYTAYDENQSLMLGTMTGDGEQTREPYSAARWAALHEPSEWTTTVHGTAAALCPYADTHRDSTVCPYMNVILVTMTNTARNITLERYYVPSEAQTVLPGGTVHFCFGRYGYQAPLTLKWETGERYMALRRDDGMWQVFDTQSGTFVGDTYAAMGTPCGEYVKVSNGNGWGRLDISGRLTTIFPYATEQAFSVREEARTVDGGLQIFSKDNEAISPVIAGEFASFTYSDEAHLLSAVAADGTTAFYDVTGAVVASFAADQTVRHLRDTCYAVEKHDGDALIGTALLRMDDTVHPDDTVVKGDVTLDGSFNTSDVRLILLRALGSDVPLSHRREIAADMNDDGDITTTDAKLLMERILK